MRRHCAERGGPHRLRPERSGGVPLAALAAAAPRKVHPCRRKDVTRAELPREECGLETGRIVALVHAGLLCSRRDIARFSRKAPARGTGPRCRHHQAPQDFRRDAISLPAEWGAFGVVTAAFVGFRGLSDRGLRRVWRRGGVRPPSRSYRRFLRSFLRTSPL